MPSLPRGATSRCSARPFLFAHWLLPSFVLGAILSVAPPARAQFHDQVAVCSPATDSCRPESGAADFGRTYDVALLDQTTPASATEHPRRLLYVATPGVRNYLEYGGHGLLVFDLDDHYRLLRRIPFGGLGADGKPLNVKGICGSARTRRLYVSTLQHLICLDLVTEQVVWERSYEGGCDRMAISPDGAEIYLPTLEKDHWKVVDAASGEERARIVTNSGSHNTIYGLDGRTAYLAGLRSRELALIDTASRSPRTPAGPFAHGIRPFTLNANQSLAFVCVNELLGFEVGDLKTGKVLHRVEVAGYPQGPVKRHGCPSHGIALTPDDREVWVTDGHHRQLHVFDARQTPPAVLAHVALRDEPGWILFSADGRHALPSTGEIVDVARRSIVGQLTDEQGRAVQSEKMLEVHWQGQSVSWVGDQFGVGRRTANALRP